MPRPYLRRRLSRTERAFGRIEIELGPFRPFERPFVLPALDELVDMTHLQLYARTLFKAILLSVQEMIEELQLQLAAVVGVEMGPVLDAVHFEPFVLGGGTDEALEISARM